MTNMSFTAVRVNKILSKISEFTVTIGVEGSTFNMNMTRVKTYHSF